MSISRFLNLRKITCGLLASIMVIGMCPVPVFADQDVPIEDEIPVLTNGNDLYAAEDDEDNTDVIASEDDQISVYATGTTSENWELSVPAELSSGESGVVALSGAWPANKIMNITCDSNVVLTSNIDKNDTIDVGITFSGLSLKGSNSSNVSGTGNIIVANIDGSTLFGSWGGSIKYYIGSEDAAPTLDQYISWAGNDSSFDTWSITSVKFVDSYTPTGNEHDTWFVDKDSGAVPATQITAYRIGTDIVIAGNGSGKIMAPENCMEMFANLVSCVSFDLSILDTSKTIIMDGLFGGCSSLTTIYVGLNWNTDAVISSDNMFNACTNLPNFDYSVIDKTNAHTGEGGYLTLKT